MLIKSRIRPCRNIQKAEIRKTSKKKGTRLDKVKHGENGIKTIKTEKDKGK
jgi:hypothetical protein